MNKKNKQQLPLKNYESYAVLDGGKQLIKFSDNTDIVTDSNTTGIDCTVKGQTYKFIPRGRNNDLAYNIIKNIGTNVTVGSNVDFKTKVAYGDGVFVYRKYRDKETGKIKKDEVLPEEYPEIFEFIENNNFSFVRTEIANDLICFYDSYVEYIFSKEDKPKLVQVKAKETTCSRISEIDEKTFKSEWHGYSAKWKGGNPEDLVVTPLLDRQAPLYDLKKRMGIIPGDNGSAIVGKDRRFIHNIRLSTPGRFYYSRPYWWSIFASGWYDFSSAIPIFKKSLIKNQMVLKYQIFIQENFWGKLYESEGITDKEKRTARKKQFLNEMNEFLAGEENAGQSFVSTFRYDRIKGFEDKDIIIKPIESFLKGGEYIEDSEEVSNTLCYAQGVHPSIIGAAPGKGKSINGTEARELFIIEQALSKTLQDATLEPLYFAKACNGWPQDIYFAITNVQLTTTDKGTGAVKNTGMPQETE